jgi:hypothetical protein
MRHDLCIACATGLLVAALAAPVCAWTAGTTPAIPAALDTIYVAVVPSDTVITPGGIVDVHLKVTQPGMGFNAYDAVLVYDPAALTFLQQSSSWQQGSYMKNACGNTFHRFVAGGDSLVINHSLLCAGISLHGPGILYNLRFRTSTTPQTTHLVVRFIQFYDDGLYVGPVRLAANHLHVGPPVDAAPPARSGAARLRISPNPFNPATVISLLPAGAAGRDLLVRDVTGRLVRTLARGLLPADAHSWVWDGRDDRGAAVASGVYLVTIQVPGGASVARAVLIQ